MAILGAALGLASGILGGLGKNSKLEDQEHLLNERKRENQSWYNRRYNEDPTQRVDAQRLLSKLEETLMKRNKAAEGRQAVMGGTAESVAAEKEASSKAMADATSQIAAASEARKDAIEQQYLRRKDGLDDRLLGIEGEKNSPFDIANAGLVGIREGIKGKI